MVFLFSNLPIEISFMIEDYVLLFYKEIHKQKFAEVLAEYTALTTYQKQNKKINLINI